jgi:HlyD family secretion protein
MLCLQRQYLKRLFRYDKRSMRTVALVSLIYPFLTSCAALHAQRQLADVLPASTTVVQASDDSLAVAEPAAGTVVAAGKLVPREGVIKISVANAQDSRIDKILVKEGDLVSANQVIAILQGRDAAAQSLKEAEALAALKRAQLQRVAQGGDVKPGEIIAQQAVIAELKARLRDEVAERQASLREAQAALQNAALTYQRYRGLLAAGAIETSRVDDAQEAYQKAQAVLNRTRADLENTRNSLQYQLASQQATLSSLSDIRPVDIEIARADLEQALRQVAQRKSELDDKLVRVPVKGRILRINNRVGEQVNTQQGIVELGQTDQMYVRAEVYETDAAKVQMGQQAVVVSEYGGLTGQLRGVVERIGLQVGPSKILQDTSNPTTDENARVIEVIIRLAPEDSAKVTGLTNMQVRVTIALDAQPQAAQP